MKIKQIPKNIDSKNISLFNLALDTGTLGENFMDINYRDVLIDMIDEGILDAELVAIDLIKWLSMDDIREYMEINDLLDFENDFEDDEF